MSSNVRVQNYLRTYKYAKFWAHPLRMISSLEMKAQTLHSYFPHYLQASLMPVVCGPHFEK